MNSDVKILVPSENKDGGLYTYSHNLYKDHIKNFVYYTKKDVLEIPLKLKEQKPGVVELQFDIGLMGKNLLTRWLKSAIFLYRMSRLKNTKIITTIHEVSGKKGPIYFLYYGSIYTMLYVISSKLITLSEYARKAFSEKLMIKSRTKLLSYLHPTYEVEINKKINSYDTKNINLLLLGQIRENKGYLEFLNDTKDVLRENRNFKIIIAGKGPDEFLQKLERLIKKASLEKQIKIINKFLDKDDFKKLFKSSSIVVLPYKEITQSGVMSMAVSFLKPIIARDIPQFKEMQKFGFMYSYKSVLQIPSLIKNIFSNIDRIETNCIKFKNAHSFDKTMKMHEKLWRDLSK